MDDDSQIYVLKRKYFLDIFNLILSAASGQFHEEVWTFPASTSFYC